jgi:hypothetical protein
LVQQRDALKKQAGDTNEKFGTLTKQSNVAKVEVKRASDCVAAKEQSLSKLAAVQIPAAAKPQE